MYLLIELYLSLKEALHHCLEINYSLMLEMVDLGCGGGGQAVSRADGRECPSDTNRLSYKSLSTTGI